jgi:hypothetical protein
MTLWMLGLCVCVLVLGGLSLDLWRVVEQRRSLAAMADASAAAGANGLDEAALRRGETLLDPAAARALARGQLARESDAHDILAARVDATTTEVRVELVAVVDLSLLGFFAGEPIEVHARAQAEPRRVP